MCEGEMMGKDEARGLWPGKKMEGCMLIEKNWREFYRAVIKSRHRSNGCSCDRNSECIRSCNMTWVGVASKKHQNYMQMDAQ